MLIRGECLEEMAKLPDGCVDLVLCDLPYGTTACPWDSLVDLKRLWECYWRLTNGYGAVVLTASQPFTTALASSCLQHFKYCWVWEKSRAGDVFNAKNKPMKKHEDILVFSKGTTANRSSRKMLYNAQGLSEIRKECSNTETVRAFFAPRPSHATTYLQTATGYPTSVLKFPNDIGFHPTQKPVALMEYMIRTYTNEGMTVLDNCMGSGTTGVACVNTGREFIGIEQDEKYFEIAERRIEEAKGARHRAALIEEWHSESLFTEEA